MDASDGPANPDVDVTNEDLLVKLVENDDEEISDIETNFDEPAGDVDEEFQALLEQTDVDSAQVDRARNDTITYGNVLLASISAE